MEFAVIQGVVRKILTGLSVSFLANAKTLFVLKIRRNPLGKKINSFACEKGVVFVCTSGFSSPAHLRDTLQESTTGKLLRLMLKKKIYNQNPCEASSSMKKFLEDKQKPESQNNQDETQERISEDGHKCVNTDPEYIVPEI